jgi:hypothetical protein
MELIKVSDRGHDISAARLEGRFARLIGQQQ